MDQSYTARGQRPRAFVGWICVPVSASRIVERINKFSILVVEPDGPVLCFYRVFRVIPIGLMKMRLALIGGIVLPLIGGSLRLMDKNVSPVDRHPVTLRLAGVSLRNSRLLTPCEILDNPAVRRCVISEIEFRRTCLPFRIVVIIDEWRHTELPACPRALHRPSVGRIHI